MNEQALPDSRTVTRKSPGFTTQLARKLLLSRLRLIEEGVIHLEEAGESLRLGGKVADPELEVRLRVDDPRFYVSTLFGGSIGAAESYMAGEWSTDDLTRLVRIFIRNEKVLQGIDSGWASLTLPFHKLFHRFHRNSQKGSRRNISAHYDLSNDFFKLFLDDTMMYSCAIFDSPDQDLREASLAKNERICQKLALSPRDHLLEIGTGWGGFAIHAASRFGCRVTTTTISKEQYALACERVREAKLEDRITVLLEDYRKLEGQFDKLVSIEMIEAVGHQFYDIYFKTVSELLKPDGLMLIQGITMADHRFREHLRSVDFIKRYIFPGSCLPSVNAMMDSVARKTDLALFHLEDITEHYVLTLRRWRDNFFRKIDSVRELGYSEEFIRMWHFYLSYCEGAFAERYIGDLQLVFAKPRCRRPAILPSLETLNA